jgi:glycosyltransferase involved in cell wall biosynthesis
MMRVAYLSLEAPRQGQAPYTHVTEVVDGLRHLGVTIDVYKPSYTEGVSSPPVWRRLIEYSLLQVRLLQRAARYDLIYVRNHFMAFPIALFAYLTRVPIIHEVNGPYSDIIVSYPWIRYVHAPLKWLQAFQYRRATALIAVTPQLREWLKSQGCRNRIEVISNGANIQLFNPWRAPRNDLPQPYVIFFGVFARWQGITTMIEAVADPAWPEAVSLVLAGDGQMRSVVEAAAVTNNKVRYLSAVPYVEVGACVVAAIAALVPKVRNNDRDQTGLLPVKLFEIMASGVPAIVSDYPGQADLVRSSRCGLVVPPNDPTALAQAVAQLAEDVTERQAMGMRGYRLVVEQHSWSRRSEQTAALIRELI